MASLSSSSFSIDGATDGSAYSRSRVLTTRKSLGSLELRYLRNGCLKAGDNTLQMCLLTSEKLAGGLSIVGGYSWRTMPLRSTSKDFTEGEFENADALQETIEKSKKVLAIQREILQKIAERRKLVVSIKNSITSPVNGGSSSQENDNYRSDPDLSSKGRETLDESYSIPSPSACASNAGSNVVAIDRHAFDKEHRTAPFPSTLSKLSVKTSDFSTSSGDWERKNITGSPPKRFEEMNSSEIEDIPRSSADFAGNYSYSENEARSSIDKGPLDLSLAVKAEEMSTLPAFLSNNSRTISLQHEESEKSSVKELTNDINEPTPEDVKHSPLAGANVMNILLVAAECAPWSKTGGLGDVAGALPKALARRGHRVMVVAPRYGNYPEAQNTGVLKRYKVAGQDIEVSYFHAYIDGVDYVFIDCALFRGIESDIYGGKRVDILKRMVLFCKAAIEVPWHVPCGGVCYGDGNLVFIANDWHTALLPVYLKSYYHDNGLMIYARSVLVIHNIAHQGRGPLDDFSFVDLPEQYLENFRLYDPVGGEHFNIFAAGLKAAHRIVTVSHGYAWELKTQEGGWGLHNVIQESDWKLKGIVNGIDTKEWSPQCDVHLRSDGYINYSLEVLDACKPQCKAALQKELGLPVRNDVPLIGFIGRLDDQKGVDIIAEAIPWMMDQDVQLVMLGTGRHDLEQMLMQFEKQYHDKVRGWVGFSVKTAHRITAGADILLMPSRFEPCGLNQLYAMSYGTVPVVHAVGGLRDTVLPFDPCSNSGYGWTFDRAESGKLIEALWNCLLTYRQYKESWKGLQRRGMAQNLSWDHAAEIYEEVLVAAKYQCEHFPNCTYKRFPATGRHQISIQDVCAWQMTCSL